MDDEGSGSASRRHRAASLMSSAISDDAIAGGRQASTLKSDAASDDQPLDASGTKEWLMTIKITPNDRGNAPGKLAEAEMHFNEGVLDGLKLVGFSIWERRGGNGRNVTFPARSYVVNGDRRSFALLRPITDSTAQERLRQLILDAYAEFEERSAIAS